MRDQIKLGIRWCLLVLFALNLSDGYAQNRTDSLHRLPLLKVTRYRKTEVIPGQVLSGQQLSQLSCYSVADAIRYFSGVQIKDYGGLGGMKTVNIRSMGTNHMGVFYDGIQLGNAQNGQIDLGKFSLDNIEAIALYNGQKSNIFQSAKDFGSAGSIYLRTKRPSFTEDKSFNLKTTFKTGSFGLIAPSLLWEQKLPNDYSYNISGEYLYSDGKYPFRYKRVFEDGTVAYDTTAIRKNGDIKALRLEAALYKRLVDGDFDVHAYYYHSKRGLPGPVVKNVFEHGQRLEDEDFFVQSKMTKKFTDLYSLKVNAKYANNYNRYVDDEWTSPTYVDNKYEQHEAYLSVVNLWTLRRWVKVSQSTDFQWNKMNANLVNFSYPTRYTLLTSLAADFDFNRVKVQLSGLGTFVHETVKMNASAPDRKIFTPAVVASYQPFAGHDLYLQAFYKKIFRMPTFNDLYYTFIGNSVLQPEYVTQYDIGVDYTKNLSDGWLRSLNVRVEGYYNLVTNKIVAVPAGNMFRWMMLNLGLVDIRGIEVNTAVVTNPIGALVLGLKANYTYQKSIDVTDRKMKNYGHQIPYIPHHSGSLITSMDYKDWSLNYSFIYTGKRYNAKYNDVNSLMQPWYTNDLGLSKTIRRYRWGTMRVALDVNNLFDQHYEVVLSYPMPGRNYRLTFNATF